MRKNKFQQDAQWQGPVHFAVHPFDPPFEHDALQQNVNRKIRILEADQAGKFTDGQKKYIASELTRPFQARMGLLIQSFRSQAQRENRLAANKDTKRALQALEKHLTAICEIVGQEGLKSWPVWYYSIRGDLENESTQKIIKDFPGSLTTMHRLVNESLKKQKHKLKPTAAKLSIEIAYEAEKLLTDFGIPAKITTSGISSAWISLTRFMLFHVYGEKKTDANLKNILHEARNISK